jgi:hypothetical protein
MREDELCVDYGRPCDGMGKWVAREGAVRVPCEGGWSAECADGTCAGALVGGHVTCPECGAEWAWDRVECGMERTATIPYHPVPYRP